MISFGGRHGWVGWCEAWVSSVEFLRRSGTAQSAPASSRGRRRKGNQGIRTAETESRIVLDRVYLAERERASGAEANSSVR